MKLTLRPRSTYLLVRTSFEGFHRWPEAPDEVAFLRDRHRHVFHVELHIPVGVDRQFEFILLKRELDRVLAELAKRMTTESCEVIATSIVIWASQRCGVPGMYACEVTEDGENGAMACADLVPEPEGSDVH